MKLLLLITMMVPLFVCTTNEPAENISKAGSEEYTFILDAEDPVGEMERRLKQAVDQQNNRSISWEDMTVEVLSEEEAAEIGVLVFIYFKNNDIYFSLEDTSEMTLTLVTQEAVDEIGENLDNFVNIFVRTADPSLDIEEAEWITSLLHHLEDDQNYSIGDSEMMTYEHGRNGVIPFAGTHFTDEITEDTLFYGAVPLSARPLEEPSSNE